LQSIWGERFYPDEVDFTMVRRIGLAISLFITLPLFLLATSCGGTSGPADPDSNGEEEEMICGGDPCNITWSDGPEFPRGIDHHTTAILEDGEDEWLVVTGGHKTENAQIQELYTEVTAAPISEDGSLGSWTSAASLNNPLSFHAQARHPDGGVIYLGGISEENGEPVAVGQVARLTFQDGTPSFSPGTSLGQAFRHATAHTLNGRIILIGGIGSSGPQATVKVSPLEETSSFDEDAFNGDWSTAPSLPAPRTHHGSVIHNEHIYVFGGFNSATGALTDVLRSTHDESGALTGWEVVGQWEGARWTPTPVVYGDYLYLLGGGEGRQASATNAATITRVELTDDGIGEITAAEDGLPQSRSHVHQAPIHEESGTIYSVGGRVGDAFDSTDRVLVGTFDDSQ
jgi:hypothetical protein